MIILKLFFVEASFVLAGLYLGKNVCLSRNIFDKSVTFFIFRNVTTEELNRYLPFTGALKEETVIEGFPE